MWCINGWEWGVFRSALKCQFVANCWTRSTRLIAAASFHFYSLIQSLSPAVCSLGWLARCSAKKRMRPVGPFHGSHISGDGAQRQGQLQDRRTVHQPGGNVQCAIWKRPRNLCRWPIIPCSSITFCCCGGKWEMKESVLLNVHERYFKISVVHLWMNSKRRKAII